MFRLLFFSAAALWIRFWSKAWMRLFCCSVPRSARINGRPDLWMHRGTLALGERVAMTSIPGIYEPGMNISRCMFSSTREGVIEIGDDSCMAGTVIVAHKRVTIGKRVMIGGGTRILDTNFHPIDVIPRRYVPLTEGKPVTIEDDVWVCLDVIILPGVTIGHGSVIGSKSVVTDDIPPMVLAAGIPARIVRPIASAAS